MENYIWRSLRTDMPDREGFGGRGQTTQRHACHPLSHELPHSLPSTLKAQHRTASLLAELSQSDASALSAFAMSSEIVYVAPRDPVLFRPGVPRGTRNSGSLKDEREGSHAREIELKRSRGEISCAECRRLKIKCDRQLPCSSCVRRGCASLCPNGCLATGQGTRFVLAATDHLHKRMSKMSERIRQLEDALAILQSSVSQDPHPLLRDELLELKVDSPQVPSESDATQDVPKGLDGLGTLSISDKGQRFFGASGGPELMFLKEEDSERLSSPSFSGDSPVSQHTPSSHGSSPSQIQPELALFSNSFPFTPIGPAHEVQEQIRRHLPPWESAVRLAGVYLDQAAWLFQSLPRDELMDDMLPVIYRHVPANPLASQGGNDYGGPHAVALLFTVFAIASLVDLTQDAYSAEADHYFQLAKAAIVLQNIFEQPNLVTIQALHLMSIFNNMREPEIDDGERHMEMSWGLLRLCVQLALTIGLHRDSARWGLSQQEVSRRRILFWDLFVADSWQSLGTGRPPCVSMPYVDCQFPCDEEARLDENGQQEPGFGSWGFRFACECVSEVASKTLTASIPSYATILDLDAKIRDFQIPSFPDNIPMDPVKQPAAVMARCVQSHARETVLVNLHRSFFAQAIIDDPVNPLRSQYAPSFLATYRSASHILKSIREEFDIIPVFSTRFWMPWTYAFSSAVVFGTIVVRGPSSSYAPSSLQELDKACELFNAAGKRSRRAAKASGILQKLKAKAHAAYESCLRTKSMPNLRSGERPTKAEKDDDLELFGGHVRTLTSRRDGSTALSSPGATGSRNERTPSPRPSCASVCPSSSSNSTLRLSDMKNPLAPLANVVAADQLHNLSAVRSPDRGPAESVFPASATWAGASASSSGPGYRMYADHSVCHSGSYSAGTSSYPTTVKLDEWVPPSSPRTPQAYSHSSDPDIGMDGMEYGHGGSSANVSAQQPYVSHSNHSMSHALAHSQQTLTRQYQPRVPSQLNHESDPRYHGTYLESSSSQLGAYQHSPGTGGTPPEFYATAPREFAEIGLASQHSGINQRWTSFMQDSGLFYGHGGSGGSCM